MVAMYHWTCALLTVVTIICIAPVYAGAQVLGVYDSFAGPTIDPIKWRGTEWGSSFGIVSTENLRTILNGELQLALTTYSVSSSGTGLAGEASNRLLMHHPELVDGTPRITAMRATVTVRTAVTEDCATEGSVATTTQAGMMGVLFNDGSGSGLPTDATGDMISVIDLRSSSRDGRRITAALARCTNATCTAVTVLKSTVFTRSWARGERLTLTMRWQPSKSRVLFVASSAAGSEPRPLTYTAESTQPPKSSLNKDLHINNALPPCAAGPVKAAINARFDDVMINAAAVDALGE